MSLDHSNQRFLNGCRILARQHATIHRGFGGLRQGVLRVPALEHRCHARRPHERVIQRRLAPADAIAAASAVPAADFPHVGRDIGRRGGRRLREVRLHDVVRLRREVELAESRSSAAGERCRSRCPLRGSELCPPGFVAVSVTRVKDLFGGLDIEQRMLPLSISPPPASTLIAYSASIAEQLVLDQPLDAVVRQSALLRPAVSARIRSRSGTSILRF